MNDRFFFAPLVALISPVLLQRFGPGVEDFRQEGQLLNAVEPKITEGLSPYAGEEVNMAVLDTLEVYECLTNPDVQDMQQAIAQSKRDAWPGIRNHTINLGSTEALHLSGSLQYLIDMFGRTDDLSPKWWLAEIVGQSKGFLLPYYYFRWTDYTSKCAGRP